MAAALLLPPAAARAAEADLQDIKITPMVPSSKQQRAQVEAMANAARTHQARASMEAIKGANLSTTQLLNTEGMNWNFENVRDLGPLIKAASDAISALHAKHPSAVADAYRNKYIKTGSLTNIEDTFKLFGGGDKERGCISHQNVTYDALLPLTEGTTLEVHKIRIGAILQHNAVIVIPKGTDWTEAKGLVFDAWLYQDSQPDKMTFLYSDWISWGDLPRLVDNG